jgi:FAD/FMN-containing dehydrogenase
MVEQASERHPQATYAVGDLRHLMRPPAAAGWGAVLAWYSLIHLTAEELPDAIRSLVRPLATGGRLVLAFHAGSGVRHLEHWFDHEVDLDVVLHDPATVAGHLESAGLTEVTWYRRSPSTWWGETTERGFVLGRLPARP